MPRVAVSKGKKRTFYLHQDVLEGIEALVRAGYASSQNALIEDLVRQRFSLLKRERREKELRAAYAAAMRDPRYRADQEAVERDFAALDEEPWRGNS